jgi:hypothetical protein
MPTLDIVFSTPAAPDGPTLHAKSISGSATRSAHPALVVGEPV